MVEQSLEDLGAIGAKGVEGGFEHGSQTPSGEQLLDDMGQEHEEDIGLCRHGIMAVHVFQSEATVLEHVEALILHLPTATAAGDHLDHALFIEQMVGCPGTVIELLICGLVTDGQFTPRNQQRLCVSAQGHVLSPAIDPTFMIASVPFTHNPG